MNLDVLIRRKAHGNVPQGLRLAAWREPAEMAEDRTFGIAIRAHGLSLFLGRPMYRVTWWLS